MKQISYFNLAEERKKDLRSSHTLAPVLLRCSFKPCTVYACYMFGTCSVINWTSTGQILDKYWTSTEHLPNLIGDYLLATLLLIRGLSGAKHNSYRVPKGTHPFCKSLYQPLKRLATLIWCLKASLQILELYIYATAPNTPFLVA